MRFNPFTVFTASVPGAQPATWETPALDEYFENGGRDGDTVILKGNMLTGYTAVRVDQE